MECFKATDGVEIAYRRVGSGREPALLLHGWMATGAVWDRVLPEITAFDVIIPELRGSVLSPAPPRSITLGRLAADVLELLARVDGRVHLVGHSMGGQVATCVAAAAHERLRSLALISPVPPEGLALPSEVAARFRAAGADPEALGAIVDSACARLGAEAREALVEAAVRIDPGSIAAGFDAWSRGGIDVESLFGIECSTLVIASDDPFLPQRLLNDAVVARIPRATMSTLRRVGHYAPLEAPGETAALLRDFWDSNP